MKDMQAKYAAHEVSALLRHFDWERTAEVPGLYEVWLDPYGGEDEVLVPLDSGKSDYSSLLNRAVASLSRRYGATVKELAETFRMRAAAFLDATRWKRETALAAGVIAWEQGEELYAAARAQLVAAAKSSREPRRYHGQASSYIGKNFLDSALMGQTDVGSFVVTAYTPSDQRFYLSKKAASTADRPPQGLWQPKEFVSGAEILDTFENALRAARSGLDEYRKAPRKEIFLEAVSDGLSYEFTKALSVITSSGDSAVEIHRERAGGGALGRVLVEFESVEAPILHTIATAFAQDPEPQNVTLAGEVTLLSRSQGEDERVIRLDVNRGSGVNKVRVRLTPEQYDLAMDAHRSESDLQVSGRLEREGRYYWIYSAHDLKAVPASTGSESSDRVEDDVVVLDLFGEFRDDDQE